MALILAKMLLDDLDIEVHALRMMKFAIQDQIQICIKLCDRLSDALYLMKTNIRVRVRDMLMENSFTLQCLKHTFKMIHARMFQIREMKAVVKRWIDHHDVKAM